MRIVEASIAILIILGVLFSLYTKNIPSNDVDLSQRARDILREISVNTTLREAILDNTNLDMINKSVASKIPESYLRYEIKICELSDVCGKSAFTSGNVYAADRVISAAINSGTNSKKIRLFIWRVE
jgi:hypothetical protein